MQVDAKLDLTTEEVNDFVANSGRFFVKLPVTVGTNFVMDEITSFIQDLEGECEIDVIVFNENLMDHARMPEKDVPKWKLFDMFIHRMHLDLLPYAEIIISVASEDRDKMLSVMEGHSINKSYLVE